MEYTRQLWELLRKFSRVNTQKSILFLYVSYKQLETNFLKYHLQWYQKYQILRKNLVKDIYFLYNKNYKTFLCKIKEDQTK